MLKRFLLIALAVSVSFGVQAEVRESTASDRHDVSVTIYNQNLGLVREVRSLTIPRGTVSLRFEDVTAGIDPTSVSVSVLGGLRDFMVLEQNYEYDLISPEKLMEKYVGRQVDLYVKHPQTGEERRVAATLLSTSGGPVYRIGEEIHVGYPGRVVLPELPENLIARPTLVWLLDSRGGDGRVEVSYLTSGMNWKADYVAVLDADDRTMNLTGWVTLTNTSGAGFENAKLKLVAGTIHRERKRMPRRTQAEYDALALKAGVVEEEFFEYHLYTLRRRTTLKDRQTKQVELLKAHDVGIDKEYVLPAGRMWFDRRSRMGETVKEHITVMVHFENSKENNLGEPLPAGIFRMYKADSEGSLQLVGEDRIDHTPRGEKVSLQLGEAFDITAERVQVDYEVISRGKVYEYEYKITIRNAKKEDVTVKVIEQVPGDWEVLSSSHEPKKVSAHMVHFFIPVKAEGSSLLTYRVRIR
ncbi:MAG: DUF4139 domain-containing protein [bacterium]|nr:MAG: DUF4139 domain-containing protein [bacterium]